MLTNLGGLPRYTPGAFGKMLSRVDGEWCRYSAATLDAAAEYQRGRREILESLADIFGLMRERKAEAVVRKCLVAYSVNAEQTAAQRDGEDGR